ncbi:MAG TPA: hypothetical protein VLZ89_05470 [Anaerolineales bacterium]|nr:hypothetical protein [Anaerolineales bacterium]
MKPLKRLFGVMIILALGALACNLPSNAPTQAATNPPNPTPGPADLSVALTLAVQTIQAATQEAQSGIPTSTVAPPATPPTVTVSSTTNCRTGPNINYDLVMSLQPGLSAEVVGKYTPADYWIIKYPGGGGNSCWLWGQYATVTGDTDGLPEMSPPPMPPTPTPVPTAPNPPKNVGLSCVSVNNSHKVGNFWILSWKWTVTLSWKDNSSNENGFYVYKNGSLLATLAANSTSYTDQFNVSLIVNGTTWNYGVASFNNYGSSVTKGVTLSSCP